MESMRWEDFNGTCLPTFYVVSDSVGLTGQYIARAVAAQYGVANPAIETLSKAKTFREIANFLDAHCAMQVESVGSDKMIVLCTLVDERLVAELHTYAWKSGHIQVVDLMTPALTMVGNMTDVKPMLIPGAMHSADQDYFKRVEAIEFTIAHDDGQRPQDLTKADIVLIGPSRTSKTPRSVYLSQQGLKVSNVPLDPQSTPPAELGNVDRRRLFGLTTTPDILVGIRKRRLGTAQEAVAGTYADLEYVCQDLEAARALMRKLGCLVIHTENRAVEETAQEILRYYRRSFGNER